MSNKRIIAFLISVIMIISVMPSIVMAEGDSLNITYEMLTDQARDCITENLTLPAEIDGAKISWASSDTTIITNGGKVLRYDGEKNSVTLTATADGKTKSFDFTVLPEDYYANYSDSFPYSEHAGKNVNGTVPGWGVRWNGNSSTASKIKVDTLSDGTTNCYSWNQLWKDRPVYTVQGMKPDGKFYVSADVYMDFPEGESAMFDYEFDFGTGSNPWIRFYFLADGTVGEVRYYGGAQNGTSLGEQKAFGKYNLPRRWVNLKWEFDTEAELMWLYIDGVRVCAETGIASPYSCAKFNGITFNIGKNIENHYIGIDNMSIVTMEGSPLALTYEMLSNESHDCISESLTLPEETEGVKIKWVSSDTSVIQNDGTVIRPEGEPQNVTLTAKAGGREKVFDLTVMPENYYVNYSDNFSYSEYENKVVNDNISDWGVRWGNTSYPSSKFRIDTFEDGTTNCYTWNELWKDRPIYNVSGIKPDGKFYVSADVYMDYEEGQTAMYDFEFDFGTGNNAWMRFYFYADGTVGEVRYYGGAQSGSSLGAHSTFGKYNLPRRWVNLKWEFDTDEKLMWLYIDGERVSKAAGVTSTYSCAPLKKVIFNIGTNVVGHSIGIDNMSIVTKYDDVDEKEIVDAYSLLNHEIFSSEAKNAVTQNLDLTGMVEGYDDITYSFESGSDNLVINGSVGEITRGEEDAEAILHVNISKESSDYVLQKTLTYNVKGSNYKVYKSTTFKYPDLIGQRPTMADGGWKLSMNPSAPGYLDAMYVYDDKYAVKAFRTVSDSTGKTDNGMFYTSDSSVSKRDVTIEIRAKMGKAIDDTQIYNLNLYGQYEGHSGNHTYSQMHIYVNKTTISMRASVYDELAGGNKSLSIASGIAVPMEWFDLKFKVDLFNKKFDIYINGRKVTATPLSFAKVEGIDINAKATKYGYFSFNPYRGAKEGEVYIDEFATYSTQGMTADVAVYNEGVKVSDLGYLNPGDTVSADVQLYNFESGVELDGASVIAGIYSGNNLYDVSIVPADCKNGLLTVKFPNLTIPETIENAKLRVFFMDKNNKLTPVREEYVFPHKLNGIAEKKEYVDSETGRTYYTLDLNGEHAIRSYYTMSTWAKDADKFYFYDNQYRLYEYDIETDKYKYIDSLFRQNLVMVSRLGNVFYMRKNKEIVRMNPNTYEKEVVGTAPLNMNIGAVGLLQVNDDESYLSVEITENSSTEFDVSKKKRIPVMDINTGEWDLRYIYGFDTKIYAPDHMNLNPNPAYSNIVAFAHEGTGDNGEGNPERIWLLNRDTGEYVNVFKQKMSYDRVPAETVGHEAWMQSGELMMFANNSKTTPGGITLFKIDGSDRRYVNNDYNYLHSAGSTVTDRFVVSDTGYNGSVTKLVLIDCYTGKSYLLATLPQNGKDPGHTHPCFSFDGTKVIFGLYAEDLKTIRVGWMDVSDIINSVADGEEIILSDSCKTSSYGDTDFELERVDGGYNIKEGNHMNVNITSFEKETVDVKVTIEYVDNGTENIVVDYIRWEPVNGKNKIVSYKETIARTNTGSVKTAEITLTGINAENLKKMATDFTIYGEGSDLTVRKVTVQEK